MTRVSRIINVLDASSVAAARRMALECAEVEKLDETAAGKAALVTTELATNLVKHAHGGAMLFGAEGGERHTLTIVSIDKGAGIANVAAAMQDGYSTAGSPGTGLGAVRRAAAFFDLYAMPNQGTAILCRIENAPRARPFGAPPSIAVGGVSIAKPGEEQAGDSWSATVTRDTATISVVDGLGHGPAAATAALAAVRVFTERAERPLEEMLQDAHGALRATRGAAVGLMRIHTAVGRADFAGVGNIAGTIANADTARRTVSLNGIVGHEMRKVQTFSYPWSPSSVVVLHSDGLSAAWGPEAYPGLLQHHPALIAAVIYRDFVRGHDDATVVVATAS